MEGGQTARGARVPRVFSGMGRAGSRLGLDNCLDAPFEDAFGHQYETVSGFICEAFGYIPRTGETIKVVLEKEAQEDEDENTEGKSDRQELKEKHQIYKLELNCFIAFHFSVWYACGIDEILAGNARKVSAVRFERINNGEAMLEAKEVARLVPRIMKRKWSSDEESDVSDYDEDSFQKRPEHSLSDSNLIAEHEEDRESSSRQ
ncbi:unnamed protein product [Dovyalis caffra]|uniref:Uncharacterized protein n=1 Tax=Dovyalis caffra TaxID=77055 RepID=A0AAV1QS19_9ROSI|nr:unnamed protein product [Dovyalis caffra]